MSGFDHQDVQLFIVVVKLGWWLVNHSVVFIMCFNFVDLMIFFVGLGALAK
jgi:hypothetical protein